MILCFLFKINYCTNIFATRRQFKGLIFVRKILVCMLFSLTSFVISDEANNITVFESDTNYTMYNNDSYENLTVFNQNVTGFDNGNSTPDVSTELESSISVTEDSDSSFHTESSRKLFLTPDEEICNCDLTSNVCDINCCCDPDCDEEDMQVFSECSHQVLTPDENYCYQKDVIFRNNTVYKMVKDPNNAMFCIVHDNFKHRLRFKDMPILKSHRDLITVLKYKYKNTYSWDTKPENVLDSSELRAGNSIYIDVKTSKKSITNRWSLPSSCFSDMCSCEEEVRYLQDFHSSCSHAIDDLQKRCEQSDRLLSGDHVSDFCVSIRSSSGTSLADLVIHTRMVGLNASDEEDDAYHSSTPRPNRMCTGKNSKRPKKGARACENVVTHIHFAVEQDGVSGVTGIAVDFKYSNVSFESRALTQGYSVSFVWTNASESEKKSGNPGYQVGLPILAATNGSDDAGPEDQMSRTFYESGLSVLGRDGDGSCSASVTRRRTINFGKNLKTGCVLRHDFTKCKILRNAVSDVLLGPSRRQVFVGVFGNANVSNPDNWIEVFHEATDPTDDDENCRTSLGLKMDVVYAAVGTVVNPQYKIVGVAYHYTKPEPVDLTCGLHCEGIVLSTSVSFFDVTLPAVEQYAKVPSIKANLPSDFFYPFLYSKGRSTAGSVCPVFFFAVMCLCYLFEMRMSL